MDKTVILYHGFNAIPNETQFLRPPIRTSGNLLYQSNHVFALKQIITSSSNKVFAKCVPETNISKKPYEIEIEVRKIKFTSKGMMILDTYVKTEYATYFCFIAFIRHWSHFECMEFLQSWWSWPMQTCCSSSEVY